MSKRQDRVNELLKREISGVIQREFDFTNCLVTVNAVDVTPDLKEAKVYISVLGGGLASVLHKLKEKRGLIQSKVVKRVVLKNTPVLDFKGDDSVEKGIDIVNLLEQVDEIPTAPPLDPEVDSSELK